MDTSNMMRHVAKIANTDQRCVVAFMQIPGRTDHALVVPIDNLPPKFEQAVMDVLKTPDGQQAMPFAEALGRHRMPDTGDTILESLHKNGKLLAVPVHNILMMPRPNQPVKLSLILEQQGLLQQHDVPSQFETEKFNPFLNNQKADSSENARNIARNLLIEAEMLEAEAKKKRDAAYVKDPSLRSNIPPVSVSENNPWSMSMPSRQEEALQQSSEEAAWKAIRQPSEDAMWKEFPPVLARNEPKAINDLEERLIKLETMLTRLVESASEPDTAEIKPNLQEETEKPKKKRSTEVSA